MKIVHVITGLNDGGAEAVLYRLCKHDRDNSHHVISLSGPGKYGPILEAIGVTVATLYMSPRRPSLLAFFRLIRILWREKPDAVQTWMYHADLFGGLAARVAGIRSVVWGIRHTTLEPGKSKKTTIWIAKILASLSWWLPAKVVVCAQQSMDVHEGLGYDHSKMSFIPNGYDLTHFRPGLDPQDEFRLSLLLDPAIPLIGMVGRFDPQKDHNNLLNALAILRSHGARFHCVLVGTGMDSSNALITEWIAQRSLADYVKLLGKRNDIPYVMNAVDLHILSSSGEAFPNVVAEAMACATPCVVSDVGDAAQIVGDTGWIVPARNPRALADAINSALGMFQNNPQEWSRHCRGARLRIQENYSIEKMVSSYNEIWNAVLAS